MQQVTMHDLEIFSNWMEKRQTEPHRYNSYNPLIKIDLVETGDRYTADNDRVDEIQFNVKVQELRPPEAHKSLLMGMSDTLLHERQRLIAERRFPMKSQTLLSLQSVELLPLPLTHYLGTLWAVSLTKTLLAMLD